MTEQLRLELEGDDVAPELVMRDRYQDDVQAFAERYLDGLRARSGTASPYAPIDRDE